MQKQYAGAIKQGDHSPDNVVDGLRQTSGHPAGPASKADIAISLITVFDFSVTV